MSDYICMYCDYALQEINGCQNAAKGERPCLNLVSDGEMETLKSAEDTIATLRAELAAREAELREAASWIKLEENAFDREGLILHGCWREAFLAQWGTGKPKP